MGELRTRLNIGIVNKVVMPVLLRTTYIDRFTKSIHPVEKKIATRHPLLVPILMGKEASSEDKMEKSDIF